jgi:hypothetical protein
MALLYGRAGRLIAKNGGGRPGQMEELKKGLANFDAALAELMEVRAILIVPLCFLGESV